MSAAGTAAIRDWLDELPALVPGLDREASVRGVLVEDALTTGDTLVRAAPGAHPLLRGHAHLALAALHLVRAQDGEEVDRRVRQVEDHASAAVAIAEQATAPMLRVDLLPRATALLAGCLPLVPDSRPLESRITELAAAAAAALTEQGEEARRGMSRLAAAMALADGAELVGSASRAAVLRRAASMAQEARAALVRAGELRRASLAREVAERLAAAA